MVFWGRDILHWISYLSTGLVASHYQGAKALMHEHNLISNLYDMIIDTNPVSRNAALALYRMSSQPEGKLQRPLLPLLC